MEMLNNRIGLTKKRKRVGRGGSRGGTSGKGHKGQKARAGGARKLRAGFEGGQMPLHRRLPKRGFNNSQFKKQFSLVTLDQLQASFNEDDHVTRELLLQVGLIKKDSLVKVLANGSLTKKLHVAVDAFSAKAVEAITACGGKTSLAI